LFTSGVGGSPFAESRRFRSNRGRGPREGVASEMVAEDAREAEGEPSPAPN